ncbi:MAG TPA: 2-C-methyl-D-erythritol 4-phosphate cytidylyltransferase [Thermoanaerobaculia bacterium]|nr:2-C-methyl-D-erythritol 4-phosphate cytidylyltransferase [Thermoanaerobaculia bacterium]
MVRAVALIPAAGFGTRFHDAGPKALVPLAGRPMLLHALERIAASNRVREAVIAISPGHENAFRKVLAEAPIPCTLVEGGVTRRESVARAFTAARFESDDDLVLVHDAARPLVDPADVVAVVDAAEKTGAAIAGYSVVETIKRVHGGAVVETVPRGDLFAATTPQVFRASLLRPAVAKEGGSEATDDAELVERTGGTVTVVLTSRWNIKITYPEDLAWAEAFLART